MIRLRAHGNDANGHFDINEKVRIDRSYCCGTAEVTGISETDDPKTSIIDMIRYQRAVWKRRGYDYTFPVIQGDIVTDKLKLDIAPLIWASHVIFTQAIGSKRQAGYGFSLAEYIRDNKLGDVVASTPALNPNTARYITVFTWAVDHQALIDWWNKNADTRPEVDIAYINTYATGYAAQTSVGVDEVKLRDK